MEHVIATLLQDFEQGRMTRRQLIQSIAVAATAVATGTNLAEAAYTSPKIQATYFHHASHPVADYAKCRDWYSELFGMKVVLDDHKRKANLQVGESLLIIKARDLEKDPVDHICFHIAGWDEDKSVRPAIDAELQRRGEKIIRRSDSSIYIADPDGLSVQIGGKEQ
jgi:catechol 2,3-dioxygenase-like lactoylglutathione lyase family enzyme